MCLLRLPLSSPGSPVLTLLPLAVFVRNAGAQYQSEELIQLAQDIEDNAYAIRESWIAPAYDELYKLNAGVEPKQVANNTRKILRL